MKRELIIGIMLAVVCGLSVKDVLDAIRCRKREEELSLRLQILQGSATTGLFFQRRSVRQIQKRNIS